MFGIRPKIRTGPIYHSSKHSYHSDLYFPKWYTSIQLQVIFTNMYFSVVCDSCQMMVWHRVLVHKQNLL